MKCIRCGSDRTVSVGAKCSDMFDATLCGSRFLEHKSYFGYVLDDLGIGGGDYLGFSYCLGCGQMDGDWPLGTTKLENGI